MAKHSSEHESLAKTTRMNFLFDWYEPLLTDRQRTYMRYYFYDDYSLGEIAAEFAVSRQAVYDQLKRAESLLEEYEEKLGLYAKYEARKRTIRQMRETIAQLPEEQRRSLEQSLEYLEQLDRS
jgi:hypothetical protein